MVDEETDPGGIEDPGETHFLELPYGKWCRSVLEQHPVHLHYGGLTLLHRVIRLETQYFFRKRLTHASRSPIPLPRTCIFYSSALVRSSNLMSRPRTATISPTSFRMGPETVMQRAPVILDV